MKYLLTAILCCLFSCFLFSQQESLSLMQTKNNGYSEQLTEHINKLRNLKSLPPIKHDSILDSITNEIFQHREKYQTSFHSFNEDSVRLLLYNKGVIDYQYELLEVTANDTVKTFKKFFMSDHSDHIRTGCSKNQGKILLLKSISYLDYGYSSGSCHSVPVDAFDMQTSAKVIVDSIKYYIKALVPGEYRFYYSDEIPVGSKRSKKEDFIAITPMEVTNPFPFEKGEDYSEYNLLIMTIQPEKYVVVVDKNNNRVALIK